MNYRFHPQRGVFFEAASTTLLPLKTNNECPLKINGWFRCTLLGKVTFESMIFQTSRGRWDMLSSFPGGFTAYRQVCVFIGWALAQSSGGAKDLQKCFDVPYLRLTDRRR